MSPLIWLLLAGCGKNPQDTGATAADDSAAPQSDDTGATGDTEVVDTGADDTGADDTGAADTSTTDTGMGDTSTTDTGPVGPERSWERVPGLAGANARWMSERFLYLYPYGENDRALARIIEGGGGWDLLPIAESMSSLFTVDGFQQVGDDLYWVTDEYGIYLSEDDGETWASMTLPWTDGTVWTEGTGYRGDLRQAMVVGDALCVSREHREIEEYHWAEESTYEALCLDGGSWTSWELEEAATLSVIGDTLYGVTAEPVSLCELGSDGFDCQDSGLPPKMDLYDLDGAIAAVDYQDAWLSTDGGESWSLAWSGAVTSAAVVDSELYLFEDGVALTRLEADGTATIVPSPEDRGSIYTHDLGEMDGELFYVNNLKVEQLDASGVWVNRSPFGQKVLHAVADADGTLWAATEYGELHTSTDGLTWTQRYIEEEGWSSGDNPYYIGTSYILPVTGGVYLAASKGRVWFSATPDVDESFEISLQEDSGSQPATAMADDGDAVFVGFAGDTETNHGTGASYDVGGGLHRFVAPSGWSSIAGGLPVRSHGGEVAVSAVFAEPGTLLVATHAGLWRSDDQGGSWTSPTGVTSFDDEARVSIARAADTLLLSVRTESGRYLYQSGDDGQSWTPEGDGLPASFSPSGAATLDEAAWFGTAEDGLWSIGDSGSWRQHSEEPAGVESLWSDGAGLIAGTEDGVWLWR